MSLGTLARQAPVADQKTEYGFVYAKQVLVTATEKLSRNMKLVAHGVSAHGSVPRVDNPLLKLSAALLKLAARRQPMRPNEVTRLASIIQPEDAYLYTQSRRSGRSGKDPCKGSAPRCSFRVTISPTIEQGGFRDNTIPATAEATLMVRPLPDEDVQALMQKMRDVIDDPAVELLAACGSRPIAPLSSIHTEMFEALERVQERLFRQAVTLPTMATGTSDSAQLRAKGVQSYGVGAFGSIGAHGDDERISVQGLGVMVEFIYNVVLEVAAKK